VLRNQLGQKSLRRFALADSWESKFNALAQTKVPTNDGRETQALRLLTGTAESPIRTTVVEAAEVTFLKGGFGVIVFPRSVRGKRRSRSAACRVCLEPFSLATVTGEIIFTG